MDGVAQPENFPEKFWSLPLGTFAHLVKIMCGVG